MYNTYVLGICLFKMFSLLLYKSYMIDKSTHKKTLAN